VTTVATLSSASCNATASITSWMSDVFFIGVPSCIEYTRRPQPPINMGWGYQEQVESGLVTARPDRKQAAIWERRLEYLPTGYTPYPVVEAVEDAKPRLA
jgi:hypothetical protein